MGRTTPIHTYIQRVVIYLEYFCEQLFSFRFFLVYFPQHLHVLPSIQSCIDTHVTGGLLLVCAEHKWGSSQEWGAPRMAMSENRSLLQVFIFVFKKNMLQSEHIHALRVVWCLTPAACKAGSVCVCVCVCVCAKRLVTHPVLPHPPALSVSGRVSSLSCPVLSHACPSCVPPDQSEESGDQTKLAVGIVIALLLATVAVALGYWVYIKKSK